MGVEASVEAGWSAAAPKGRGGAALSLALSRFEGMKKAFLSASSIFLPILTICLAVWAVRKTVMFGRMWHILKQQTNHQ